jgi:MFS family permease
MFYVPAFAGGIFGLLGGYLTDLFGRRRILTYSILLYAISAFIGGYSTSLTMLLIFRSTKFVGVCVEFVAAVAWLAELFPDPKRREKVLGYTQAFSSIGGLMVAGANLLAVYWVNSKTLPHVTIPAFLHPRPGMGIDAAWRYTMMSGLIPAIPLLIIRPFLPESPAWQQKKSAGTLRRPSIAQLFSPQLARTTIITTIMFACSYGAAFGAIQQMPQIVPGLPEVQERIKAEVAELPPAPARPAATKPTSAPSTAAKPPAPPDPRVKAISGRIVQETAPRVTMSQEVGGLVGRLVFAILALYIVSRQTLIRMFQVPGLFVMAIVFGYFAVKSQTLLSRGMFIAGFLTVAQFSFWGNYLPRVYPVHLRGTGESFAANIGGRMIGTSFAALTIFIAHVVTPESVKGNPAAVAHYWAYASAGVGVAAYAIGLICSFFLPEPGAKDVDESAH